jgi:hypothetical protein
MSTRIARRWVRGLVLAAIPALGTGCDEGEHERSGLDSSLRLATNENGGAWINNGLSDPSVCGIDPAHPLASPQGMAEDVGVLVDEETRPVAQYLVECALPLGSSIVKHVDGEELVLEGYLGLAPQWEQGACDVDCQQWVSACMLARTNVSGQSVQIALRGAHPALSGHGVGLGAGPGVAGPEFSIYEASFFGNLFADPDAQYMCPGPLVGPLLAQLEGRTCSALLGGYCDMTEYSLCTTLPLSRPRCGTEGLLDPMVVNCRPGAYANGSAMHTISSYVQPL